jgi:hypothetical protein
MLQMFVHVAKDDGVKALYRGVRKPLKTLSPQTFPKSLTRKTSYPRRSSAKSPTA